MIKSSALTSPAPFGLLTGPPCLHSNQGLKIVQHQLEQCDEEFIPHFKLTNVAASRKSRRLFYVRRPRELEGVAVWMGQHIVLLPPDGREITFYDRTAPLIGRAENISLQGDTYYWPTEPKHALDVQSFDSPLVLPTRADVCAFAKPPCRAGNQRRH